MPTLLTPPTLEVVLQGLHESEIRCGIQNEPSEGGITAWIDFGSRTEKATFYGTLVGDRQVWQAADRIAAWMQKTALRLFPDSPYAKNHTSPVVGICKTNYPHVVSVLSNKMSQAKAPHRKAGLPPILNRPTMVNTRLSVPMVAAIDKWATAAGLGRSDALWKLVEAGLRQKPPKPDRSQNS